MRTVCRKCGHPVTLEQTEDGQIVHLDAEPSLEGNVMMVLGKARLLIPALAEKVRSTDEPLYQLHHDSCESRVNGTRK